MNRILRISQNFQFWLFCFLIFISFVSSADDDEDGKSSDQFSNQNLFQGHYG